MPSILLAISSTKFWRFMCFVQWSLLAIALGVVVYPRFGWMLYVGIACWLLCGAVLWWQNRKFEHSMPIEILLQETHLTLLPNVQKDEVWFVSKGSIVWAWLVMLVLENDAGKRRYLLLHHTQLSTEQWSALLRCLKMGWGTGALIAEV